MASKAVELPHWLQDIDAPSSLAVCAGDEQPELPVSGEPAWCSCHVALKRIPTACCMWTVDNALRALALALHVFARSVC